MTITRTLSRQTARRLAVSAQLLAGPRPRRVDADVVLDTVRRLGCLQIDPTAVVAKTQFLVLWSRLGRYEPDLLRQLTEDRKELFEYWAHAASYVLAEDYPIHMLRMRSWHDRPSVWGERVSRWLKVNDAFRRDVLRRLRADGPMRARDIPDSAVEPWVSTGWTHELNVTRMLDMLSVRGQVHIARRVTNQRYWDIGERCLPPDVDRTVLPDDEVVRRSAHRALQALGVGTPRQIREHFTRGCYPGLDTAVAELTDAGTFVPVNVADVRSREQWYVPASQLELLDAIEAGQWKGRTTLLSPFDNLICDRERTLALWDFDFKLSIYTPAAKRVHGFFVLPVLHNDRLVGRAEPVLDRKAKVLRLQSLHWEPGVRVGTGLKRGLATALRDLAAFVGADEVTGVPS